MAAMAANPYYTDAKSLWSDCKPSVGSRSGCINYVTGVIDGINLAARADAPPTFCMPERLPRQPLADMIATYIQNHPDRRQEPAAAIIGAAMAAAYPCSK
jgi:hypothetical protein